MAKVILGNHFSVIVPRQDRDNIRKFYCDVLGATITRADPERDFIRLGDDFYVVLWGRLRCERVLAYCKIRVARNQVRQRRRNETKDSGVRPCEEAGDAGPSPLFPGSRWSMSEASWNRRGPLVL